MPVYFNVIEKNGKFSHLYTEQQIAIAKRLEKVLPQIIHFDQNAYVKGRTIFDAVRTIDDVIEFTKRKGHKGILTAIDVLRFD